MLYLAWDIDGTLLLTNRAGYDALQEATCDYFFRKEPYEFKHTLAGCTDSSIIKEKSPMCSNIRWPAVPIHPSSKKS